MKYTFQLETGDTNGKGHCISEKRIFSCTHSSKELIEAYEKGSEITDFDLIVQCSEYEENAVSISDYNRIYEKLKEVDSDYYNSTGFTPFINNVDEYGDDHVVLCTDEYVELFLAMCKVGNPSILLEEVTFEKVDIGGYGLYY